MSNKEILLTVKYNDDDMCVCHYYTDFTFKEEYPYSEDNGVVVGKWKINKYGEVRYLIVRNGEEWIDDDDIWILDSHGKIIIDTIIEQELLKEE